MGMTDTESGGWYRFDTDGAYKPVWTNILSKYGINLTNGWIRNGRLCGLGVFDMGGLVAYYNYVEMDLNTGELLEEISVGPDNTRDFGLYYISCAYVPEEDRIYGYTQTTDQSGYRFCSSPADNIGDVTVIRDLDYSGDRANSFCYNPADDSFYGVTFSGNFVKVDREGTRTFLFVGRTKMRPYIQPLRRMPDIYTYVLWLCLPAVLRISGEEDNALCAQFSHRQSVLLPHRPEL